MHTARLIWSHGALSQPWGTKSRSLARVAAAFGLTMEGIDFQDLDNPDDRVKRLTALLAESDTPAILCGSSMGGYVSSVAAKQGNVLGLFLLAHAFYLEGYDVQVFSDLPETVTVVHGWRDDVVPVENAIRFARLHAADLHILPDGHRLSNSNPQLGALFTHFLERLLPR